MKRYFSILAATVLGLGVYAGLATSAYASGNFDMQLYGHSGYFIVDAGHNYAFQMASGYPYNDFQEIDQGNGSFELQDSYGRCMNTIQNNTAIFSDTCVYRDANEEFVKTGYVFENEAGNGDITIYAPGDGNTYVWSGAAASWSTPGS